MHCRFLVRFVLLDLHQQRKNATQQNKLQIRKCISVSVLFLFISFLLCLRVFLFRKKGKNIEIERLHNFAWAKLFYHAINQIYNFTAFILIKILKIFANMCRSAGIEPWTWKSPEGIFCTPKNKICWAIEKFILRLNRFRSVEHNPNFPLVQQILFYGECLCKKKIKTGITS
jgi:hypothetical protein